MQSSKISFTSGDNLLVGLLEIPEKSDKPMIMLLHGLTNSMKDCPLINEATLALHDNGFPTFKFDYFGSGESPGKFSDKTLGLLVKNTQDALTFITKNYRNVGIWGRSLGAILGTTICDKPEVFATVLLSSTIKTRDSFSKLFENNSSFSQEIKGTGAIKGEAVLPKIFYEETAQLDKLQKHCLAKAKNVLVVQGTEDKIISNLSWAKDVYQTTNEPKKIVLIEGAGHSYEGFEPRAVGEGIKWFEKCYEDLCQN